VYAPYANLQQIYNYISDIDMGIKFKLTMMMYIAVVCDFENSAGRVSSNTLG